MTTGGSIESKLERLKGMLKSCVLCPRRCRVDRTKGERGFCGLPAGALVSRALAHHGEEPPISGTKGAGTIFLSSCNLRCRFCQNYQISRQATGEAVNAERMARIMLDLQEQGCHNIEPVTPTPHLPALIEGYALARLDGLAVPLVYNCGGYEDPEVLRLLEGLVDIYLPDFKYGNARDAHDCCGVNDYPVFALESAMEMVRQVGDNLDMLENVARRGIIIRHLVLPGRLENSLDVLRSIKERISTAVPISLMSQYTPIPAVRDRPDLGRRLNREEYERIVDAALEMGFDTLFIQELNERNLVPDFNRDTPFVWER